MAIDFNQNYFELFELECSVDINSEIAEELALPPVKIHCSVLAEDAIKAAVNDYYEKNNKKQEIA